MIFRIFYVGITLNIYGNTQEWHRTKKITIRDELMFKLYIFNPEHDMVLGKNSNHYLIPKSVVEMRTKMGYLPALLANDNDWVLVDNITIATNMLHQENRRYGKVRFVEDSDIAKLCADQLPSEIIPWGWDRNIAKRLTRLNPNLIRLIPSEEALNTIRKLSSRSFVAENIIKTLIDSIPGTVGEMTIFNGSIDELACLISQRGEVILKSPWSCSGRGVNYVKDCMSDSIRGWAKNTLKEQELIIIEPYYNKVCDFAMEFVSDKVWGTKYLGLSIFTTINGRYSENIIDNEENKRSSIGKYIPIELLDIVCDKIKVITSSLFYKKYSGSFGVDMMIVNTPDGYRLHPCVELNLRLTMGHASLQNFILY